jgi:hypothetical protein
LDTNFQEQYASLSDEELLRIAGDRRDLREEAAFALDAEMAKRGLTHEQARARKRDDVRLEIKEARAHHPTPKKSKYFVTQINLGWFFTGLVGLVLLMFLTLRRPHRLLDEWTEPVAVVYTGALMACLAVQPWLRRTASFWFSLAASCIPQFFVSRWLSVYHPSHSRNEAKGMWFLSILAGYVAGGALFLLLQRLKPMEGPEGKVLQ